jgi:hypothetical protein
LVYRGRDLQRLSITTYGEVMKLEAVT